jgi:two-component system cell cycle sensor histidine kinase/response regulator CckA
MHMRISIYGTLTLTAPLLLAGWSLILFWLARKRVPEKYLSASVAILFTGIVLGAVLDIEIPILSFVTLSSVGMLGYGILKRQLFNPLRERNIELAREIEERMRMTEEIRKSETHVKALLEGIPDAIFYLDKDARFLDFKAPSDFMPIVLPEVFMGKTPDAFFPQELAAQIATYTKKAIETGEVQHLEYSLPEGDQDRYYEARIVRRSEQNVLCIVRDVTRKKELEGWLLQTQKMEAIHRLAGGIAHDFNNLLTVMLSFADLSIIQFPSASVPEYLEQIKGSVLQATELTQQLLSFSRKQLLVPKVTNLNEIVSSMQTLLAHLIGDSIVIRSELDPGLASVRVDPGQMRQVIMNLALNAKDALPGGGTITIRTENRFSGECEPSWPRMSAGHYVTLFVRDTGIGMDKETISHIFEPFFTTKKGKSGTGLGLAIVHGIVTQSNGFITVKSEVGAGTEFGICLPAITADNDSQPVN